MISVSVKDCNEITKLNRKLVAMTELTDSLVSSMSNVKKTCRIQNEDPVIGAQTPKGTRCNSIKIRKSN